jgi:hypothetical protein
MPASVAGFDPDVADIPSAATWPTSSGSDFTLLLRCANVSG